MVIILGYSDVPVISLSQDGGVHLNQKASWRDGGKVFDMS